MVQVILHHSLKGIVMHRTLMLGMTLFLIGCAGDSNEAAKQPAKSQPAKVAETESSPPRAILDASPLPRARTLREFSAAMRSRAIGGDARAACQLARELDFCAGVEERAHQLSQMADRVRATQSAGPVTQRNKSDVLKTLSDLESIRSEYCEGFSDTPPGERVGFWREAALRGHLPSMIQYGAGLAFARGQMLATLDELSVYKKEGERIMGKAAQSGNLQANLMLARAYAPQLSAPDTTPLLRQAVRKNASKSFAYYMLTLQLKGGSASTPPSVLQLQTESEMVKQTMSPAEVAEAERMLLDLQQDLHHVDEARFDPIALNKQDLQQPVPTTSFCEAQSI